MVSAPAVRGRVAEEAAERVGDIRRRQRDHQGAEARYKCRSAAHVVSALEALALLGLERDGEHSECLAVARVHQVQLELHRRLTACHALEVDEPGNAPAK